MTPLPHIAWWRHAVRLAVLVGLFAIAGSNMHRRHKAQYGGQFVIDSHPGLRVIDRLLGSSPHMDRRPVQVSGGLWSFKAGPVRASDPLAVLSGILTARRVTAALLLSLLIPLIGVLWGGRLFCSWLCPMGLLGEAVRGVRRRLERLGIHFFNLPISRLPKYVLLVTGALACLLFSVPFFYGFYPPRILSGALRDSWSNNMMMGELIFVGLLLLCELVLCERLWCKSLCPGGALLAWMSPLRRLRVQHDEAACTACGKCDLACPYDLDPSRRTLGGECDNCGRCIEVCQDSALEFRIGSGLRPGDEHRTSNTQHRTSTEETPTLRCSKFDVRCWTFGSTRQTKGLSRSCRSRFFLILSATLLTATTAPAHHIRGIPHYSYQENYPQAPLFEEFRDAGPWTMQFTFWPIPAQKALDLALYVKHATTDKPYDGPVTFRVYQEGEDLTDGNHPFAATANPRHIHKVGWVYEEDGIYYAEITLGEGPEAVTETFRFQVGKVKPNTIVLTGIAIALLALIAAVAIIKRRQLVTHAQTSA